MLTWFARLSTNRRLAAVAFVLFRFVEQRAGSPMVAPKLLESGQMRVVGLLAIATGLVEASMVFLPSLAARPAALLRPAPPAALPLAPAPTRH